MTVFETLVFPVDSGALFNTLANGFNKKCNVNSLSVLQNLKKRAISKFLTVKLALKLAALDSPLKKAYLNTYYCNHVLEQDGKTIIGKYCSNRWCYECNRIRTAKLINGYKPVVKEFKDPAYIVLTVKNIPGEQLRSKIQQMNAVFRKLVHLVLIRDEIYIEAIRTIEVTYNILTGEYHPHFNVIVNGSVIAKMIIREWLMYFPENEANESAQYVRPVNDRTLNELFKYVVKFDNKTPVKALDVIFRALHGIKITAPSGVKKVIEDVEDLVSVAIPELVPATRLWWWKQGKKDWVSRLCWPEEEGVKLLSMIERRIKLFNSS